jgi:hypothetical protein
VVQANVRRAVVGRSANYLNVGEIEGPTWGARSALTGTLPPPLDRRSHAIRPALGLRGSPIPW